MDIDSLVATARPHVSLLGGGLLSCGEGDALLHIRPVGHRNSSNSYSLAARTEMMLKAKEV